MTLIRIDGTRTNDVRTTDVEPASSKNSLAHLMQKPTPDIFSLQIDSQFQEDRVVGLELGNHQEMQIQMQKTVANNLGFLFWRIYLSV